MDRETFELMNREMVSRRLKAARWLAGTKRMKSQKRQTRDQPVALTTTELAQHEMLMRNKITSSRLEEIEQERTDARPIELACIAQALGLPADWFEQDLSRLRLNDVTTTQLLGEVREQQTEILEAVRELLAADALRIAAEAPQSEQGASGTDAPASTTDQSAESR